MKNFKQIPALLMLLMVALTVFNSCKKGPEDPFLSFSSRDNRVTAKWKLTKIEGTDVTYFLNSQVTTTITYDGTVYTETPSIGTGSTATGTYELTIDKEGKVSFSEVYTPSGGTADIQSGSGTWFWMNADKNKDILYLNVGGQLFSENMCHVNRLSSKDMILQVFNSYIDNGHTYSTDFKYTFTKE